MRIVRAIKRAIKATIPPLFFLALSGYFIWNTLNGDHGLRSFHAQEKLLVEEQTSQQNAISEQNAWSRRLQGLKENSLEADLLDERSRTMLNTAQDNEIVVPYAANDHLY